MNTSKEVTKQDWTIEELNELIIDSIQDIKGKKIVQLDLRQLDESPTDFFIVCEGESNVQVKSISDNIHKRMKQEAGNMPNHIEGQINAQWILLDYFNTVVHVFHKEARKFYELEELWSDAIFTEYESL